MTSDVTTSDRQIHTALLSYCRGIDRLDAASVLGGFHPGATLIDYGPEPMTIEVFVEYALASLEKKYQSTQHRISNTRIEYDERGARVESYVLAFHVESSGDGPNDQLHTFNGRYIDRFTEVDGLWRISERTLRNDWSKSEPIEATMGGAWQASGRAGSADPLDTV